MAMTPFKPNQLLNRFPQDLASFHAPFVTVEGIASFANDNARQLKWWWHLQLAKLLNPKRDHGYALSKQEFTLVGGVATGLPVKRLSSCHFKGNTAASQSAEETQHAFNTDAETGNPLPPMQPVVSAGFV